MIYQKALLTGSTGLIGSKVLSLILDDDYFTSVEVWARKPSGISHPKLRENIMDLSGIDNMPLTDAGIVFCCLGTTIKKAGTQQAFRRVDYDYAISLGRLAERSGSQKFLIVSSLGADKDSRTFYLRTKGELEEAVRALSIPSIFIFRPSILLGKRSEFRFGEITGKALVRIFGFLLFGRLKRYRGIKAATVARAMVKSAKDNRKGVFIFESDKIFD